MQVIRRNQVYFSSSSVSTDTSFILRVVLLSHKDKHLRKLIHEEENICFHGPWCM